MIFPIGDDDIKGGHYPLFSYGFIALNVLVFIYQANLPQGQLQSFIYTYGAIPAETSQGQDLLTVLTSIFLHGGLGHLLGNMLFLWIFADNIEATIGNVRFFLFYIAGGIAAYLVHFYFNVGSSTPTVGASGAISAVMGAYLVMFPRSRVKLFFFFFIFRIPAFIFLGIWFWQQWSSGTASLRGPAEATGIAYWAHIGGFFFGALLGLYFRSNSNDDAELVPS
ncbi:MAG: rhomboid family intramembrane serine protease [Saprospiraceae bacterium]|nr:rhomboid family intramembrane serine protease [Saprospiraceae bacterium]